MGLLDTLNRQHNEIMSARQRKENEKQYKKELENELYKYFNKYFKNSTDAPKIACYKLQKLKEKNLQNTVFDNLTDYEKNKLYNKILNDAYKNYEQDGAQTTAEIKKTLYNYLYTKLEKYYIYYGVGAFEMLQDYTTKSQILTEIINIHDPDTDNIIYLKREYQKINKLLYNEFRQYTDFEEVETIDQTPPTNWGHIIKIMLKILFFPLYFPVMLALLFGLTYKPKNKKR